MSDDRRSLNSIDDIEFAVRRIDELEAKVTEEEKLKVRIARTRKLLEGINELYWNDFAHLSAMLEVCIEILDGKRDEG